jgi:hypothetical protein
MVKEAFAVGALVLEEPLTLDAETDDVVFGLESLEDDWRRVTVTSAALAISEVTRRSGRAFMTEDRTA